MVPGIDKKTLQSFVNDHSAEGTAVYTDDHQSYLDSSFNHETVKPSVNEYVRGQAHTNGIKSFWSLLKIGYYGTLLFCTEK